MKIPAACLLSALVCCTTAHAQWGHKKNDSDSKGPKNTVLLSSVLEETEQALDDYQTETQYNPGDKCRKFPPLTSASFDFKTTVDQQAGGKIQLLVFTVGASGDAKSSADVSFVYVPKPNPPGLVRGTMIDYRAQILGTLREASRAVMEANADFSNDGKLNLNLKSVTVTLDFGVTKDASGGVSAPISIVTLSGNLDRNSSSAQEVKLTFENDNKVPLCASRQ